MTNIERHERNVQKFLAEQPAQQQEPEYAWPTVADYERDVGFQTNEAFRIAWNMARTTNRMLGHASSQPAQQEQNRQIDQLIQERDHRDEIIDKLCDAVLGPDRYEWSSQYFFEDAVREVEERMAEQPAQQEPFGYFRYDLRLDAWVQNRAGLTGTPFYTSPPAQRTWVGLTDEEVKSLCLSVGAEPIEVRFIEAKLKEKNT